MERLLVAAERLGHIYDNTEDRNLMGIRILLAIIFLAYVLEFALIAITDKKKYVAVRTAPNLCVSMWFICSSLSSMLKIRRTLTDVEAYMEGARTSLDFATARKVQRVFLPHLRHAYIRMEYQTGGMLVIGAITLAAATCILIELSLSPEESWCNAFIYYSSEATYAGTFRLFYLITAGYCILYGWIPLPRAYRLACGKLQWWINGKTKKNYMETNPSPSNSRHVRESKFRREVSVSRSRGLTSGESKHRIKQIKSYYVEKSRTLTHPEASTSDKKAITDSQQLRISSANFTVTPDTSPPRGSTLVIPGAAISAMSMSRRNLTEQSGARGKDNPITPRTPPASEQWYLHSHFSETRSKVRQQAGSLPRTLSDDRGLSGPRGRQLAIRRSQTFGVQTKQTSHSQISSHHQSHRQHRQHRQAGRGDATSSSSRKRWSATQTESASSHQPSVYNSHRMEKIRVKGLSFSTNTSTTITAAPPCSPFMPRRARSSESPEPCVLPYRDSISSTQARGSTRQDSLGTPTVNNPKSGSIRELKSARSITTPKAMELCPSETPTKHYTSLNGAPSARASLRCGNQIPFPPPQLPAMDQKGSKMERTRRGKQADATSPPLIFAPGKKGMSIMVRETAAIRTGEVNCSCEDVVVEK
eukprot:CAMPEP_0184483366 /NCGR_PEP_ID=MMETSP0113_2-20130426/5020_1 /TAXON_ID=91329 /ORGANISM="Norrisiella sphaerica, Strain BC52" /LENGTH=644 /DNA_ID=CAMNT_0026863717 /DNA_START=500 /DNA_END=2434 /DNA_ORIENTATION=+